MENGSVEEWELAGVLVDTVELLYQQTLELTLLYTYCSGRENEADYFIRQLESHSVTCHKVSWLVHSIRQL